MLKVKSFPLDKTDEANLFMETHLPLTTDKMNGIQINMGYLVVFYDDGILNKKHIVQKFQSLISKEEEEIILTKDKIARLRNLIQKTVPAGYKDNLTDNQLLELCIVQGDSNVVKKGQEKSDAAMRVEGIILQENDLKMQVGHITDCQENIKMFTESKSLYEDNGKSNPA